ncbi:hypothetical protein [Nonlabens sp. Asnod3-A02]|uniref:hypothetical protein n=1 Tax=Nonlabens sp. Asnod3-A02 TaxID=3160579 RepID=UPI00386D5C6D
MKNRNLIAIFSLFLTLFTSLQSFSQTEEDYRSLISITLDRFEKENLRIYKKFENNSLLEKLDVSFSKKFDEVKVRLEKNKNDSLTENVYLFDIVLSDTLLVNVGGIKVNYNSTAEKLKKTNGEKIKRYVKSDFIKRKTNENHASLSFPLLSSTGTKAIIYVLVKNTVSTTQLHLLEFEKTDNKWIFLKSDIISWTRGC